MYYNGSFIDKVEGGYRISRETKLYKTLTGAKIAVTILKNNYNPLANDHLLDGNYPAN
jgi:hypothetical protein